MHLTKKRKIYLAIILVAIIGLLITAQKLEWIKSSDGLKVSIEEISRNSIVESVTTNGKIQPELEVIITPNASGEIVDLNVKEGDTVVKGQLLLKIDPDIYQSARDAEPRWRRIEPYAVLLGLRYYLIGRDAEADDATKYRQYRFDRILQINLTVETFERDPNFDVEEYSTLAFGAFFSEEEYGPVCWKFAPSAAPAAREFVFHPKQEMTDLEDGSLLVEFAASGWVEMAWHLVEW